ncbi:MAG: hypothetical protein PVH37_11705 [Desulfobacterales bacterium]|jgi:hypothetical protein
MPPHRRSNEVSTPIPPDQQLQIEVDTQEGELTISPETVDDWDNGYYIAYPDDGSKPYVISPAYVRQNYELV